MLKVKLIIFTFIGVIGFGLIIAIPISVLSSNFSSYDVINANPSYEYLPDDPSEIESLILNFDYGNVEIKYIDPPVDYYVKIELNIEMGGKGLEGRELEDYFNIVEGDLTSTPINFTMRLLPGISFAEAESIINNVSVIVSLRKGITFNISTSVVHGNVDIVVPFNVRIGTLDVNILNGNILFDLYRCTLNGNIRGVGNRSDIKLISYDVQLSRNSFWYFQNSEGLLEFDIDQSGEMGANVTIIGELETSNAVSQIYYDDSSSNVGLMVTLNNWNDWPPAQCYANGFNPESIDSPPIVYYKLTSYDFPARNYFNISLYRKSNRYRPYLWFLSSVPN